MSKICFELRIEHLPQQVGLTRKDYNVFIKRGDGSYKTACTIDKFVTPVEGIAEYTGDTRFIVAPSSYGVDRGAQRFIDKEGVLLFYDNVLSINHYTWGGCSVSALLLLLAGALLAWFLGFIKLNLPAFHFP